MYTNKIILGMLLSVMISACTQAETPPPTHIKSPAQKERKSPPESGFIACPQDAKQCPDGSFVGRSGPHCEFICPSAKP